MKRIWFSLIISFCLFPNIINALECNSADKERLQKLASNITVSLEEYQENGETYFRATFAGLSKELTLFNETQFKNYYNVKDSYFGDIIEPNLLSGRTYDFVVYGSNTCYFDKIRHIKVITPKLNKYYNDALCENAREYKMCQKWFNGDNISYDEFVNNVNTYINNRKKDDSNNNDGNNNDEFNFDFGKFYRLVYFPSLAITIVLIGLLIFVWSKENKKNRL